MATMLIRFHVDGGFAVFPGLSRPVSVDVGSLPDPQARSLQALIHASGFFERSEPLEPVDPPASGSVADQRKYLVTVEDDSRCRTLVIPESIDDPDLKALVAALERLRRSARAG